MTLDPDQLGRSKQDLAELLRNLRLQAGLTGDRLAARCGISQSKISKIERGKATPSVVDVERILGALDAPRDIIRETTSLARIANTEWQDKRSSWRRGIEKRQAELSSLEAAASELRYFLPAMITGLLATPEYMHASLANTTGDRTAVVNRKIERQALLYDESKSFTFILTEQAVRWAMLPPLAMAMQIDRLASLSHHPSVRLGLLPIGTPLTRGPMNTFTIYDDRLATVETFTGRIVFRDSKDICQHLEIFTLFEENAVFGEAARGLLAEWSAAYRT
ncbi:helix-turn-helix transcriptional regulator [Kitasatospora sp. CM 4170]|uniref:Helix-turn-helix domain-containing protein n=1 Tax=Kitasatospora aburaviensis TaxID=67265 RepID=A0ABW1F4K1_9ACTN|nr:helix-turn-helix transcriptional regulator [Kitasatospora sp. CM 4170]WNM46925.1 helix-turn-helix transcriptional regulator [Kitasatospora sp. CM 4170]